MSNARDSLESKLQSEESSRSKGSIESEISASISPESFQNWYRERQYRQNIENGTPYFNDSSYITPAKRHSPSSLLQCHRKLFYRQKNAPAEIPPPTGIFWIGSEFEEEIAVPYLREAITAQNQYVTNSMWIDFTVDSNCGELRIKGQTDPVIVDSDGVPILLTEIKTKDSVQGLDSPNLHHRAQVHAYMKGLSEKFEERYTDAVIIYGSRKNLNLRAFNIEFDPVFWGQTVLDWAESHTEYRLNDELPPGVPEFSWECEFCPYKERCGKGETNFSDVEDGFLPGFNGYPRDAVIEYLDAHTDSKLTPSLAKKFPSLAEEYEVSDWKCPMCSSTIYWRELLWEDNIPLCPRCTDYKIVDVLGDNNMGDDHTSQKSVGVGEE